MNKKSTYDATEQGYQYCNQCKKDTWHTPKLGLVFLTKGCLVNVEQVIN